MLKALVSLSLSLFIGNSLCRHILGLLSFDPALQELRRGCKAE